MLHLRALFLTNNVCCPNILCAVRCFLSFCAVLPCVHAVSAVGAWSRCLLFGAAVFVHFAVAGRACMPQTQHLDASGYSIKRTSLAVAGHMLRVLFPGVTKLGPPAGCVALLLPFCIQTFSFAYTCFQYTLARFLLLVLLFHIEQTLNLTHHHFI